VLRQQLFWQVLIVVATLRNVEGIVVRDDDGSVGDPHVPIEPLEHGWSQVAGVPTCNRLSERSAQMPMTVWARTAMGICA
jgi:hypothetical protein